MSDWITRNGVTYRRIQDVRLPRAGYLDVTLEDLTDAFGEGSPDYFDGLKWSVELINGQSFEVKWGPRREKKNRDAEGNYVPKSHIAWVDTKDYKTLISIDKIIGHKVVDRIDGELCSIF